MKCRLSKGILTATAIAARMTCSGQVYSQSIPSFTERNSVSEATPTNNSCECTFPTVDRGGVNICIASNSVTSGTNSSYLAWIVSTDVLATQPKWDGISNSIPLTIDEACGLILPQVRKRFPEVPTWTAQSISLRKPAPDSFPNLWCYEFVFDEQTNAYAKRAFVLLDGTVVLPTIIAQ